MKLALGKGPLLRRLQQMQLDKASNVRPAPAVAGPRVSNACIDSKLSH